MKKSDFKKVKDLMHSIGLKYNLTDAQIKEIVESPYEFTKEIILEFNFENVKSKEELEQLKTNFNYKALGKMYISYPLLKMRQQRQKTINNLNNKDARNK